LDGQSLTVAGVVGAARYSASVALDEAPEIRERMTKSRDVLVGKVEASKSVYGVSTGLGGSGACHALVFTRLFPLAQLKHAYHHIWIRAETCRTANGLQRTRGRSTRSALGTPSYSITTLACCRPQRPSWARFLRFRCPTRSPGRACPRRGCAARFLCASTRSSVVTQLCAGNYSRRWSHC